MTPEEKQDFKEYLHNTIAGYIARIESQQEVTNIRLGEISAHLQKQNGRVSKAEEAIAQVLQEREGNRMQQATYRLKVDDIDNRLHSVEVFNTTHSNQCPHIQRIRKLEDDNLTNKSIKKFMSVMFMSGIALGGFVVGLLKLIIG